MSYLRAIVKELPVVLFGIAAGVLLEDRIKWVLGRIGRFAKRAFRRVFPLPPPRDPYCFTIGGYETDFVVVDGTGVKAYPAGGVTCTYLPTPADQPEEVEQLRRAVTERERARAEKGLRAMENGPLYALKAFQTRRSIDEDMTARFDLIPTDYFTFQATVFSLDEPIPGSSSTLRRLYLDHPVSTLAQSPAPFMANAFGVIMVLVTSDDRIILGRRSDGVGGRRGELDATFAESMLPTADKSDSGIPDPYRTAVRGLEEELGLVCERADVHFLGFGLDLKYYQWSLVGLIRTDKTAKEVLAARSRGADGNWESDAHDAVPLDPKTVFALIRRERSAHQMWATGFVAIYWTLVHLCGRKSVEDAGVWAWPSTS